MGSRCTVHYASVNEEQLEKAEAAVGTILGERDIYFAYKDQQFVRAGSIIDDVITATVAAAQAALFKLNPAYPFWAAALLLVLAVGVIFWQVREPAESAAQSVETRPGLIASLRTILAEPDKSALLLLLAIFAWFVGYNAVSKYFTLYGVIALKMAGRADKHSYYPS